MSVPFEIGSCLLFVDTHEAGNELQTFEASGNVTTLN